MMNKLRLFTLFFASLFMLSLVSCSKDDDADLSKTDLITGGEWSGNQLFVAGQDVTQEFETYVGIAASEYKFDFKKDGSCTIKYDTEILQSGTWEFGSGEQSIIINKGMGDETEYVINKLTSSELFLEGELVMGEEGATMTMEGEIRLKR